MSNPNDMPKQGQLNPIQPNLIGPSVGLNDDFLLDDSMETPEAKIHVQGLKDTPPGAFPEENDKIDLVAAAECECEQLQAEGEAALEELSVALRDVDLLRIRIREEGGMTAGIALECNDLMPGFVNEDDRLIQYFTQHPTKTMMKEALESMDVEDAKIKTTFTQKLKAMFEKFVAWVKSIGERLQKMFSKKSSSMRIGEWEVETENRAKAADEKPFQAGNGVSQEEAEQANQTKKGTIIQEMVRDAIKEIRQRAGTEVAEIILSEKDSDGGRNLDSIALAATLVKNEGRYGLDSAMALLQTLEKLTPAQVLENFDEYITNVKEVTAKYKQYSENHGEANAAVINDYFRHTGGESHFYDEFRKQRQEVMNRMHAFSSSLDVRNIPDSPDFPAQANKLLHFFNAVSSFSSTLLSVFGSIANADSAYSVAYFVVTQRVTTERADKLRDAGGGIDIILAMKFVQAMGGVSRDTTAD